MRVCSAPAAAAAAVLLHGDYNWRQRNCVSRRCLCMHKEVCNTIMLVKVMRDVRRWQSLVSLSQQQFVTRLPAATPAAQVLLYTVDGASLLPVAMGSLPGGDVLATVDFGPTTDVEAAFALQKRWAGHGAVCSLLGMCVLLGGCVQPNSLEAWACCSSA